MTTENLVNVPQEGEIDLREGNEEDTSSDSPSENNTGNEGEGSEGEGAGNDKPAETDDDKLPFHQHPRWKQREDEWQTRFNVQEQRHQDDIKSVREEFAAARKDNAENTDVPSWFGGTQEQWNEYIAWNDKRISSAEERALQRITEASSAESKAVKDATDFMRGEITSIEGDKNLNPDGKKVDPNKLLKIVMDNDLVDSKGRWNYRAGFRMMQNQAPVQAPKPKTEDRKTIAGATTSDQRGEVKPKNFKTNDDFKQDRPW